MLFQLTRCPYFFSSRHSLYMASPCLDKHAVSHKGQCVYVGAKNVNDVFSYPTRLFLLIISKFGSFCEANLTYVREEWKFFG